MIPIWQAVAIAALSGGIGVLIGVLIGVALMALMAACAAAHYDDDTQGNE